MCNPSHPQGMTTTEGVSSRQATAVLSQGRPSTGVRHVRLRTSGATLQRLPGGVLLIKPEEPLQPYIRVLTDRLQHWANVAPERVCLAQRGADDQWRHLTYGQVWESIQSIGQALLDRGLSAERPVAILSENCSSYTEGGILREFLGKKLEMVYLKRNVRV